MLDWIKKQSVASWLLVLGAIFGLVAVIIYGVNSTTGVMSTIQLDTLPIILSVIAIVLLAGMFAVNGKVPEWVISVLMVVVVVFFAVSIGNFIFNRTDIAGNQWFIPGLDTPEQGACLNGAITGIVFYVLAIASVVVSAFIGKSGKKA